jgi:hypothetical protein
MGWKRRNVSDRGMRSVVRPALRTFENKRMQHSGDCGVEMKWHGVPEERDGVKWEEDVLDVLGDGEDVAVGIFEPGDMVAGGGRLDAEVAVFDEEEFFGWDAAAGEPFGYGGDVFDFPSQGGALKRDEIGDFGDADFGRAGTDDETELIKADQLEAEFVHVVGAGLVVVFGGDEADELCGIEH